MCADYDKNRFTQILIKRDTKDRLDLVKEVMLSDYNHNHNHHHSHMKNKTGNGKGKVSYNDTIIALLDNTVVVASGGQSFLLAK